LRCFRESWKVPPSRPARICAKRLRRAVWRSPDGQPSWARPVLLGIAAEAVALQRLAAGHGVLDLGPGFGGGGGGPLPITASQMGCLLDALSHAYDVLGLGRAADGDEVFRDLVVARIIEPVSKLDSLRVLEEAGVAPASYATLKRRLPVRARDSWRQRISAACAAHAGLGPASLVLYEVSTLYFETDAGDGFREPGVSKERRLEPQIGWGRGFIKICTYIRIRSRSG
jgi:hypothetical protein